MDNIDTISNEDIQFTINDQLFLETLLMEIRGKTISYASFKKKQNDSREKQLINEISILEENITENLHVIDNLKNELLSLRKIKMEGCLIRSRAQCIEEDEKPSKFFCNLESHNYLSKIIPKLELSNGNLITSQSEILSETKLFYENLYSSKDNQLDDVDLNEELNFYNIPKLSIDESNGLEGQLTFKQAKKL